MKRTALITGASGGIGFQFAKLLAQDAYNVVLIARTENRLLEIKKEFEQKHNVHVLVFSKDLTKPNAVKEIYNELKRQNIKIDVLINNAGFGNFGKFYDTDWEKEAKMLQLNIFALTHLTKLFLKDMVDRGEGKILNVSSTSAFQPGPLMSIYYASKAYVQSFSEAIAKEVKGTGVTVTTLCPGPVKTGFQKRVSDIEPRLINLNLADPESVARYGYRALQRGDRVAIPGLFNQFLVHTVNFIPRNAVTDIIYYLQEKNRKSRIKITSLIPDFKKLIR
ncbi:MAG: short-chain dehydrogenase [Bacteroidetes bacterium]|nr:MAG: short-chain dehydrogenase [Bacteroidota bacterium]